MGKTYKDKLVAKFKKTVGDYNDLSINIKSVFSKHKNNDFKNRKKDKNFNKQIKFNLKDDDEI